MPDGFSLAAPDLFYITVDCTGRIGHIGWIRRAGDGSVEAVVRLPLCFASLTVARGGTGSHRLSFSHSLLSFPWPTQYHHLRFSLSSDIANHNRHRHRHFSLSADVTNSLLSLRTGAASSYLEGGLTIDPADELSAECRW